LLCVVSGFGCRASGFGLRVSDFEFRSSGFGLRSSGFGLRVSGLRFKVPRLLLELGDTENIHPVLLLKGVGSRQLLDYFLLLCIFIALKPRVD